MYDLNLSPLLLLADVHPGVVTQLFFKIKSPAPSDKVQEMLQMIEKGCHRINSLKNPVPVAARLVHNGEEITATT